MFCGKCGEKNEDNAKFCVKCGEKLNNSQLEKSGSVTKLNLPSAANDKNRKVGIAAVAIVLILVICVIGTALGGRSCKKTANQFVDAVFNADAKTIINLIPKAMVKSMVEEGYYSKSEMVEDFEEMLQSGVVDVMERYIGEDWKLIYKVLKVEDISSKKLKDIKEKYKETANINVSDAKIAKMELTIKSKDDDYSDTVEIHLIKVGRSWYIDFINTSIYLY